MPLTTFASASQFQIPCPNWGLLRDCKTSNFVKVRFQLYSTATSAPLLACFCFVHVSSRALDTRCKLTCICPCWWCWMFCQIKADYSYGLWSFCRKGLIIRLHRRRNAFRICFKLSLKCAPYIWSKCVRDDIYIAHSWYRINFIAGGGQFLLRFKIVHSSSRMRSGSIRD